MDKISITGLECFGYHGCSAAENELGQRFTIDAMMELDLHAGGCSDDIEQTADYAAIMTGLRHAVESTTHKLIEAAAEDAATWLLASYPLVQRVTLTLHKPASPIPEHFRDISVTITREREQS